MGGREWAWKDVGMLSAGGRRVVPGLGGSSMGQGQSELARKIRVMAGTESERGGQAAGSRFKS